ncbi:MAG: hypothetical protein AVDCRST_MAG61-1995, partial [uncultured Friedmanniella sp.]
VRIWPTRPAPGHGADPVPSARLAGRGATTRGRGLAGQRRCVLVRLLSRRLPLLSRAPSTSRGALPVRRALRHRAVPLGPGWPGGHPHRSAGPGAGRGRRGRRPGLAGTGRSADPDQAGGEPAGGRLVRSGVPTPTL